MNSRIFTIIATLLIAFLPAVAADYVIAEGSAIIVANYGETTEALKARALAQAKNNAIIGKFGERNVSSSTLVMTNDMTNTHSSFQSQAAGEWLGDVVPPEFKISGDANAVSVEVKVKGKIRKIPDSRFDTDVTLLRNGTGDNFKGGTEFFDKDDIFLKFVSPVDCYVAVYLLDPKFSSCLLPYSGHSGDAVFVLNNLPYIFFSKDYPSGRVDRPGEGDPSAVATYYLMADVQEINELYVIYSKKPFVKALDSNNGVGLPRQLSVEEFQKWLTELRTKMPEVNLKTIQFTIFPK